MRKHLALTTLLAGALGLVTAAHAVPTLQIEVFDGAKMIASSPVTSGGSVTLDTKDANFSHITVAATGVPLIATPDVGAINVAVSAAAPATLHVLITQVGLAAIPASISGTTTSTYNALIGGPGPLVSALWTDAGNAPFTKTTLEAQHTFNIGGGPAQTFLASSTLGPYTSLFSETVAFDETFTAVGQDLQATLQFAVPEPASIGLLGAGLVLLGLRRRRRATEVR